MREIVEMIMMRTHQGYNSERGLGIADGLCEDYIYII